MRPVDVIRRVAPHARPEYLAAFEAGDGLLARAGVTTPLRLAHFLAQILEETGGLRVTFEDMSYSAPRMLQIFGAGKHSARITAEEAENLAHRPEVLAERVYGLGNPHMAAQLGNTQAGDGYRYRGGGILQTTGRGAYRTYGRRCGVDFEGDPELICAAEHALKPALGEWTDGRCNDLADRDDIHAITKRINGGYTNFVERVRWLDVVRPLIDTVELKATPPYLEPLPVPPPPARVEPRHLGAGGSLAAALAAAWRATDAAAPWWVVAGLIALGLMVAVHVVSAKKGHEPPQVSV